MVTFGVGAMLKKVAGVIASCGIGAVAVGSLPLLPTAADGQAGMATPARTGSPEAVADAQGNLRVPSGYQTAYEWLGTWAIAAKEGSGIAEIHNVYATPGTIEAYRKTEQFPDGTVLVKEVRKGKTMPMTTGTVSHGESLVGWFVMVKDRKNAHPGNPLWGDGWGWSWFDAKDPLKTTSTNYKSDCLGCHVPARSTDWVYISGYAPLLKR